MYNTKKLPKKKQALTRGAIINKLTQAGLVGDNVSGSNSNVKWKISK